MTNNIFATATATATATSRQLDGTAKLTSFANNQAASIIREYANDESLAENLVSAMTDTNALESLVDTVDEVVTEETAWLKELDNEQLDKMLKSQQSKRSRCKSKEMTQDNFTAMLSAAIAERGIRIAMGKPKGATSTQRRGKRYTDEDVQMLANDQEALRKAIRNIQSKKSIMKSKAGFDETSEEYQALLEDEQKLKAVRIGEGHVDATKQALKSLFGDVVLNDMKAADYKALFGSILELTGDGQQNSAEEQ